jgi:thiamine-phosphate pyrophosphorylase
MQQARTMAAQPASLPPVPRIYLATPPVVDPAALSASLPALLAAADVAAVLVRLAPGDDRALISRVKALAPVVQKTGAALLIDGHFEMVARAGADGANLTGIAQMEEAMPTLKPDRIIGVGGLQTRHDAMVAGETGADYVLFGEPGTDGERPSADAIAERLQWWAEVFEPPCVGFAATLAEAGLFATTGAEFIMLGDAVWRDPRGAQAALAEASSIIAQRHRETFGTVKG